MKPMTIARVHMAAIIFFLLIIIGWDVMAVVLLVRKIIDVPACLVFIAFSHLTFIEASNYVTNFALRKIDETDNQPSY